MVISTEIRRNLGTMIAYGFPRLGLDVDLAIAARIGAEVVEVLPSWRDLPDPLRLSDRLGEAGLILHSAHGCWGGQAIRARRVDLGGTDPTGWRESVEDLRACVDWLQSAGGSCLVVHPGGLSEPEDFADRRAQLVRGLAVLADHAHGRGVMLCVENMPTGVFPGSRMADLFAIVEEVDRPEVALALDTGHAQICGSAPAETLAAGTRLCTTHVHDNNGRQDLHLPPGLGRLDWGAWIGSLDAIDYRGPIVLECIRHLRDKPEFLTEEFHLRLRRMVGLER